jgi:hypothetical protein
MRPDARYVVGLFAICLSPSAAALPLSWVESERAPILAALQVLQIAHRYLGADALYDIPPTPTFVDFTDREPMGLEVDAVPAWIVTIDGLDLVHAKSKETVRTTLYMALAGGVPPRARRDGRPILGDANDRRSRTRNGRTPERSDAGRRSG